MEEESERGGNDVEGNDEEECEEGRASVGRKSPKELTIAGNAKHERTRCPYRSWCRDCVKSRARNAPHRKCVPEEPFEEVKAARVHMGLLFHVQRR